MQALKWHQNAARNSQLASLSKFNRLIKIYLLEYSYKLIINKNQQFSYLIAFNLVGEGGCEFACIWRIFKTNFRGFSVSKLYVKIANGDKIN